MKCSLGISNFLEEMSFPLYCFPLFHCIDHLGRLSYLSLLFFGTLHSSGYNFPFLPCFLLLFFSQLFVRPPQTTILPFLHFFFLEMVLITTSCTMSQTSVHSSSGILSIRSNPLNLFVTSTVYNKGFDLKDGTVKVLHPICQQIWKTQQWPQD